MGEIIPNPKRVAQEIAAMDGVRYASGETHFHDSGVVHREVSVHVDTDNVAPVEEALDGAGYEFEHRGLTSSGDRMLRGEPSDD